MTATHGNRSQILVTSTPNISMTNQALTDSGDHTTFNISNAPTKRIWDRTAAFTFQTAPDGSTWTTVVPSVIRYPGGLVTFASAVTGGTPSARISSGAYLPYAALADAIEWAPELTREVKDSTTLTTSSTPTRWKTFKPGLVGGLFKINKWLADPTNIGLFAISTADTLVASFVLDVTAGTVTRLESFGYLTKDSIKVMTHELETEDLEFVIDGGFYLNQ